MGHTPGPWRVVRFSYTHSWGVLTPDNIAVAPQLGNKDDARLIAAAPELLEALKDLLDRCYTADDQGELSDYIDGFYMDKAQAAIVKTTEDK